MARKTLVGTALAVLTALGVLTGCGENATHDDTGAAPHTDTTTSSTSGATPAGEHNAADITFLQQMIPHHTEAVEMATLAEGRTTTASVVDLANRIKTAQGPEIEQMTNWLESWGQPTTPPASPSTPGTGHSMPGMDHGTGGSTMPGAMSAEQMSQLEQASGTAFDQQWLSMMVAHHRGAIDMATSELSNGSNAQVKALAQQIIDTQQAEIKEMQALLGQS
jgi:uncharacterized protein (DUF305 family)